MEILGDIVQFCLDVMSIDFTLWGVTLNLWHVLVFVVVIDAVFWFVWEVILNG